MKYMLKASLPKNVIYLSYRTQVICEGKKKSILISYSKYFPNCSFLASYKMVFYLLNMGVPGILDIPFEKKQKALL